MPDKTTSLREPMVFFLSDTAEVWSYAVRITRSIPAGREGQLVTAVFGQTLEQLQQRFPDMVLISETEAIALKNLKIRKSEL